jgi:hypothetical protein
MKEFEQPFPHWVKTMVASVVCLWLALVGWVWKNPGWVWGGGKLYLRCVMLVMAYLLLLPPQTNFDFCLFADAGTQKTVRQRQEKDVTACRLLMIHDVNGANQNVHCIRSAQKRTCAAAAC